MTAKTLMPVLPQEDPKELETKTQRAITAWMPRDAKELDMVCRIVRLEWDLDRAERVATAHLAHRVRMATRSEPGTVSGDELERVHELGCKLFFPSVTGLGAPESTGDDYPAVIVRRLEESAQGCRWLLARWAELRNVLDRKAAWDRAEIIRFVGLLGQRSIEAHFDQELNALFHAFDALGDRIGHKFWRDRRDMLPPFYKGGFMSARYREIAPPPSDETAALTLIRSVIERHVGRLQEVLAEHESIEAAEAAKRYDRAALDCSPEFERHRRYQSARHRELMQTLQELRRMRNAECETVASGQSSVASESGESGKPTPQTPCADGVASGECRVASGECGVASESAESGVLMPQTPCAGGVASGECGVASECGEIGDATPPTTSDIGVAFHPESAIQNPKSEECSVASAAGESGQATQEVSLTTGKVQNEANLESTQGSLQIEVESPSCESDGRKRSQFAQAVARAYEAATGKSRVASHTGAAVNRCQSRGGTEPSTPGGLPSG